MKSPSHSKTKSGSNGQKSAKDSIDVETELGMHPGKRPVDIEHDVTDLGQRKRVSSVLTSPVFKEELESVVTDLLKKEEYGFGLGQSMAQDYSTVFSPFRTGPKFGAGCISPINDLTGSDTSLYQKGEKILRCKLAALYRLVDMFGWSQTIYNHISVRVSQEHEHFILNPFGLLYHEVSASKLIKVNMQGDVLDSGTTTLGFNKAGFILHSAIHGFRPDIKCIIHVHTPDVVAVSMMEGGLLPISQEALIVGDVSYHPYHGLVVDAKEKKAIQKHLGANNKVMFLQNHGMVACGETIEEAFHYLYHVMIACATQIKVMSCVKHDKIHHLDKSVLKARTKDVVKNGDDNVPHPDVQIKWGIGEMMFESLMRMIDNMGYRSGYVYRNPVTIQKKHRGRSDVEYPATSFGHPDILEDMEREIAEAHATRLRSSKQPENGSGHASVNGDMSPGTKPKRYSDGSKHSTPVRGNANQFVPTNTDPREVLEKRNTIRGKGKWDENRPGPQSQLLHGVAPENKQLQDGQVATASKGIIQKDFHANTVVNTGPPNPFANMTDSDIKEYQEKVMGKKEETSDNNGESDKNTEVEQIKQTTEVIVSVKDDVVKTETTVVETTEVTEVKKVEEETTKSDEPPVTATEENTIVQVTKKHVETVVEAEKSKNYEKKAQGDSAQANDSTNEAVIKEVKQVVEKQNSEEKTAKQENNNAQKKDSVEKVDHTIDHEKTPDASKKKNGEKNKKKRSLSFLKKKKDKK